MRLTTIARLAAATTAIVALGACSKDGGNASNVDSAAARDSIAKHDSTVAMAKTDSTTMKPGNGWTAPAILGYATAANMGEIEEGNLAAKRATSAAVKAYGKLIATDHQAMLDAGKTYATSHNATPDTTTDNARDLMKGARDEVADLTKKTAGTDWDKNFLDKEIDGHKHVLDKLQDAAKNTTDTDIKAMLEKATGKVQEHLTKAQDLRAKIK